MYKIERRRKEEKKNIYRKEKYREGKKGEELVLVEVERKNECTTCKYVHGGYCVPGYP